jgi:hypothetical protein
LIELSHLIILTMFWLGAAHFIESWKRVCRVVRLQADGWWKADATRGLSRFLSGLCSVVHVGLCHWHEVWVWERCSQTVVDYGGREATQNSRSMIIQPSFEARQLVKNWNSVLTGRIRMNTDFWTVHELAGAGRGRPALRASRNCPQSAAIRIFVRQLLNLNRLIYGNVS